MSLTGLLALLVWLAWSAAAGAAFVSLFWPRRIMPQPPRLLLAALALITGWFFASLGHLLWMACRPHGPGPAVVDLIVGALLLLAGLLCWRWRQRRHARPTGDVRLLTALPQESDDPRGLWRIAAGIALFAGLVVALVRLRAAPHGEFDAISMWNVRARFFFRDPEHWRDAMLSTPHRDYPLMLPLTIARMWWSLGVEAVQAPAALALLYAGMIAATVWSFTRLLAGPRLAALALLMLTASSQFAEQASFQYADLPLACALALGAALAMLSLQVADDEAGASHQSLGLLALAGLCCGIAAWTKNEGQLITLSAALATLLIHRAGLRAPLLARLRRTAALLAGAALPFLLAWVMRRSIGQETDLFAQQRTLAQTIDLLTDPARHGAILSNLMFSMGDVPDEVAAQGWLASLPVMTLCLSGLLLSLAVGLACWPWRRGARPAPATRWAILFLITVAAGYYVVLLLTPREIQWHAKFSVTRLFMHLWPVAALTLATAGPLASVTTPTEPPPAR
jgi:hypothetical protein